jgi:DNA helicase-2/ATP-dependent DNA helicase PcrA
LHNAKGLEFPIVFIIGLEDGVFPHSRAIEEGNVEEERRLAYVGLTRAMRDLTLTYARRRMSFGGAQSMGMRSRFLDEIPRELTDQPQRIAAGFPAPGRVASWSSAATAAAEASPADDGGGQVFRMGDDVIHAAFGEGVVTATEPGGIVVVRFASDGSERKLMADYAPIRKR